MKEEKAILNNKIQTIGLLLFFSFFINVIYGQTLPFSDQQNTGNWILNTDISDEFENAILNENQWLIQGRNGEYQSNFRGRPPSQFSTENVRIENGKLKLQTKWEPDYNFNPTQNNSVEKYENITTAAVISKKQFHYGYMEIKSKAAKARITSSFWTTGKQSELDMFEMFGDTRAGEANINWRKRLKFNIISWNPNNKYYLPDGNGPAHTRNIQADFNTADDFHVYGFEWTSEYIKVFIDGVLHPNGTILKSEITNNGADPDRWTTDVPYWIWVDSETFPWLGLPNAADLPADYEIEYIRIWDKKNLVNSEFFGFEKTINIDNDEKQWFIPNNSTANISVSNDDAFRWNNSLKFTHNGTLSNNIVAFSPFKSVNIPADDYKVSLKIKKEPGSVINNFQVILEDPYQILDFDVSAIETEKWITVSKTFSRNVVSGSNDRLRVRIQPADVSSGSSTMYIDDISINPTSVLNVGSNNIEENKSKVYPNPIDNSIVKNINIKSKNAKQILLYNAAGIQLLKIKKTTETLALPVRNLSSGIYFLSIISDKTKETKKIIIK